MQRNWLDYVAFKITYTRALKKHLPEEKALNANSITPPPMPHESKATTHAFIGIPTASQPSTPDLLPIRTSRNEVIDGSGM